VDIKYFATFRDLTGEMSFHLGDPPADVAGLLELLSIRYGTAFRCAVFEGDELSPFLILLVNGRNVRISGGLATPLNTHDDISVFPMVAGG
jgi:molybdopterin synthase sulfur carrier subunit